jgi:hypothetical protein
MRPREITPITNFSIQLVNNLFSISFKGAARPKFGEGTLFKVGY